MKKKLKKVQKDSVDDAKKGFAFTELDVELEKDRIEVEKTKAVDLEEGAFGGDRESS